MNLPFVRIFTRVYATIVCDNCNQEKPLTLIVLPKVRVRLCAECLADLKRKMVIAEIEVHS